jgi:hypothetical protein
MFLIALARLNQFIWIVPIIVGTIKYKRLSLTAKTLYWGLIGTLCFEVYASILACKHISNLLVYSMLDYFLSILFTINLFKHKHLYSALFYSITVICFFIYFHCLSNQVATIGGYDMLLLYVINSLICIIRIRVLSSSASTDIFSESEFWILSGLLIYFFSTSSLFYLYKYSSAINSLHLAYHTIYLFFCLVVVATLFTRAMLCKPKAKIS